MEKEVKREVIKTFQPGMMHDTLKELGITYVHNQNKWKLTLENGDYAIFRSLKEVLLAWKEATSSTTSSEPD